MADLLDRLGDKFLVGDGCWDWTASKGRRGYGQVWFEGRVQAAHRVLYKLMVGPIPEGLQLDHLCRNTGCVRPDHLEPVTQQENLRRGLGGAPGGAWLRAKTHCPAGHEYAGNNLYVNSGRRRCVECRRLLNQAWRLRKKETAQ